MKLPRLIGQHKKFSQKNYICNFADVSIFPSRSIKLCFTLSFGFVDAIKL